MAWPHIYIFRAAKTVADFRNGVKSGEAQKGHVFSTLSQIPNIDRRLWVRHGALPKVPGHFVRAAHRMRTQVRHVQSLRRKEHG